MRSKLLVSISLLSLAAFIFAFSAYAVCSVNADCDTDANPVWTTTEASATSSTGCTGGSYDIKAVVGNDNKTKLGSFSGAINKMVEAAAGWNWENPRKAISSISAVGDSDNAACSGT